MLKTKRLVALSMLLLLTGLNFAQADKPQEVIKALATEDLLAVGYVDLNSIDLDTWLKWAEKQELIPSEFAKGNLGLGLDTAKEILRQIKETGASHVIALGHQQDLDGPTPPLIAISIAEGAELDKTIEGLQNIVSTLLLMSRQTADFKFAVCKGRIVAGTAEQIARARTAKTIQRPNLIKAWEKFSGHDAGVVIFGNQDNRRVIRELFPPLDAPYKNVTGSLFADKVTSVGFSIDFPNGLGAKLVAQTQDVDAANIIRDALVQIRNTAVPPDTEHFIGIAGIGLIEPQIKGTDVVLDLGPILNDKALLAGILKPTLPREKNNQPKPFLVKDRADAQNDVEVQAESLEGTWSLVEQKIDGETNPNTFLRYDLTFTDDNVSLVYETADGPSSDGKTKYRFTTNTDTTPKQLNWFGNRILIQAIYELKGDSLTIVYFGKPEIARPDSFDHKESSRSNNSPHIVWKFQRKR